MMKKLLAMIVMGTMVFSLAACGNSTTPSGTGEAGPIVEEQASVTPAELFANVWASYKEDEKFPMAGGDFDHANMENPDVYDIVKNKDMFMGSFVMPEDLVAQITGEVVTAQHMMNANTFSGAMFTIADASKAAEFADGYKKAIQSNMWMCGMPDTVVVLSSGNLVVVAYGEAEIITTFKNHCNEAATLTTLVEAPAVEG